MNIYSEFSKIFERKINNPKKERQEIIFKFPENYDEPFLVEKRKEILYNCLI